MSIDKKDDLIPILEKEIKDINKNAENIRLDDFENLGEYWIANVYFDVGNDINNHYLFHIRSKDGEIIKKEDETLHVMST